jgi:type VI secretion system protein ImpA
MQLWQFEQSSDLATIVDPERRQQRIDAGIVPYDTVENEARAAGIEHFTALRDQAVAAAAAWRELSDALDARAGADAPPTRRVSEILDRIVAVAGRFASPEGATPAADGSDSAPGAVAPFVSGAEHASGAAAATTPGPAVLASREDALRALATIAEFFRRTEPLSPLSYTLQEAVRRARMTWPELLAEIVPDTGLRAQILISLGIRPPPE